MDLETKLDMILKRAKGIVGKAGEALRNGVEKVRSGGMVKKAMIITFIGLSTLSFTSCVSTQGGLSETNQSAGQEIVNYYANQYNKKESSSISTAVEKSDFNESHSLIKDQGSFITLNTGTADEKCIDKRVYELFVEYMPIIEALEATVDEPVALHKALGSVTENADFTRGYEVGEAFQRVEMPEEETSIKTRDAFNWFKQAVFLFYEEAERITGTCELASFQDNSGTTGERQYANFMDLYNIRQTDMPEYQTALKQWEEQAKEKFGSNYGECVVEIFFKLKEIQVNHPEIFVKLCEELERVDMSWFDRTSQYYDGKWEYELSEVSQAGYFRDPVSNLAHRVEDGIRFSYIYSDEEPEKDKNLTAMDFIKLALTEDIVDQTLNNAKGLEEERSM